MEFDISLLLVRLALGLIFIVHGWPKIRNMKMTTQHFDSMGFRPGTVWGTLVAIVEFFGGLAIFFGFYAQPAALGIAIIMLIALFWKISKSQGLVGGYELDLILFAAAMAIALLGSGAYSVVVI